MTKHLALHETLEVHELLIVKNLTLTKSATMNKLVQDPELKAILTQEVAADTKFIHKLKTYLTDRSNKNE
ncbi:hypothetical protein ABE096_19325 [Robertmurraya massiliosenegalensis]|uniref:hypothetical protein n=1 Tax=Robertmurraya TaxID=2837507 RepID=UPI0039A61FB2